VAANGDKAAIIELAAIVLEQRRRIPGAVSHERDDLAEH